MWEYLKEHRQDYTPKSTIRTTMIVCAAVFGVYIFFVFIYPMYVPFYQARENEFNEQQGKYDRHCGVKGETVADPELSEYCDSLLRKLFFKIRIVAVWNLVWFFVYQYLGRPILWALSWPMELWNSLMLWYGSLYYVLVVAVPITLYMFGIEFIKAGITLVMDMIFRRKARNNWDALPNRADNRIKCD